jgi:HAD superfamily hydrolase (TIGR01509 family)
MEQRIPPAVIFDCDGTLVDSEAIHAEALQQGVSRFGVDLGIAEVRSRSVGIDNATFLACVANEWGVAFPADAESQVEEIASCLIESKLRLVEGADEVVRRLASNGAALAVASNSRRRMVQQMLRVVGLESPFGDRIVSRDDVRAPKPAPDAYLLAARRLEAHTDDCMAIEDSPAGIIAARRAGIRVVVGFSDGSGTYGESDLLNAGASLAIEDLRVLLRWPL